MAGRNHNANQRRYAAKMQKDFPEWLAWKNMKIRCNQPSHRCYDNYGGRGISVCDRWTEHGKGFFNFLEDMGRRPDDEHDIDRIDANGNYSPTNCRWLHRTANRGKWVIFTGDEPEHTPFVPKDEYCPF